MKALTTAIYNEASGTTFMSYIGNRFYKGRARTGAEYPYAVYKVVTNTSNPTFSEDFEDTIIQFSLFSIESGTEQIENMHTYLRAVYDEAILTIADSTCVWMRREYTAFQPEEHTTPKGTRQVWSYHVEFSIKENLD